MSEVPERRTILVTGAAGPAGRALAAQVAGRAGLRAQGVDLAPQPVAGFESVDPAPAALAPEYDAAMRRLLDERAPDLVIPTVAEELPRIAVLGLAAGLGRRLVLSAAGPVAVAADKLLTMWALADRGVAVPAHCAVDRLGSAAEATRWAGGPVVVKPRVARGGRGVRVIEPGGTGDDPGWTGLDGSWLVQEFAPGREYSPQVFRSPVTGECRVVVLEKTGRKEGRVGNATTVRRLPKGAAADVEALAVGAIEALDLVGPADLDVRRLADGRPVVLEVNSRFGALSAHAPEILDAVLDEWPR